MQGAGQVLARQTQGLGPKIYPKADSDFWGSGDKGGGGAWNYRFRNRALSQATGREQRGRRIRGTLTMCPALGQEL